jgi:serine/threonine protein kinase
LFKQLCSALEYAHGRGVVHHDVKLENIFLDSRNNAVLGDWGYAQRFKDGVPIQCTFGSIYYSSPEVVSNKAYYAPEVDLWGLGVCLYAMVMGELPFYDPNDHTLRNLIRKAELKFARPASAECQSLLQWMLQGDRSRRPTLAAILAHPWTTGARIRPQVTPLPVHRSTGSLNVKERRAEIGSADLHLMLEAHPWLDDGNETAEDADGDDETDDDDEEEEEKEESVKPRTTAAFWYFDDYEDLY